MKIKLGRINPEGEIFEFDKTNKDFASHLSALIGDANFKIKLSLKEMGDAIEAEGSFESEPSMECSFCSEDYPFPLRFKFKEYLFPKEGSGLSQKNRPEEDKKLSKRELEEEDKIGPNLLGDEFLFLDYLYDKVGFHIPFQIPCQSELENCENYSNIQSKINQHKAPEEAPESPFAALGNMKIDKKH